jgi:hypothetical protein
VFNHDSAFGIELEMTKKDEQRKKRKLYEGFKKFQDTSTTKLPWAKFVFDEKGEVQQVRCKVCTSVEGKQKLMATKLDSLFKHQGHRKAKVPMPSVDARSFYFNKKIMYMLRMNVFTLPTTDIYFGPTPSRCAF